MGATDGAKSYKAQQHVLILNSVHSLISLDEFASVVYNLYGTVLQVCNKQKFTLW